MLLFANMRGKSIVTVCSTHRFRREYEFASDTPTGGEHRAQRVGRFDADGVLIVRRYYYAMFDPADAPDPDLVYANYLRTCAMLGRAGVA